MLSGPPPRCERRVGRWMEGLIRQGSGFGVGSNHIGRDVFRRRLQLPKPITRLYSTICFTSLFVYFTSPANPLLYY